MLEILYEKEDTEFFDREDEICQSRESEVKKPEIEEKDTDKNLTEQKKKEQVEISGDEEENTDRSGICVRV